MSEEHLTRKRIVELLSAESDETEHMISCHIDHCSHCQNRKLKIQAVLARN